LAHTSTVLSQLLKLIPRHEFQGLANRHHQGQKLRKTSRWDQFVSLLMAQLSGRQSLRDIEANMNAQASQRYHSVLGKSPNLHWPALMKSSPTRSMKRYSGNW